MIYQRRRRRHKPLATPPGGIPAIVKINNSTHPRNPRSGCDPTRCRNQSDDWSEQVMANWATEHLVNFFLDLGAALGAAWLFFHYQPILSDYLARRSIVTRENRVARLTARLAIFEELFNDPRIFVAYLIATATRIIGILVIMVVSGIVSLVDDQYHNLMCTLQPSKCEQTWGWWYAEQISAYLIFSLCVFFFVWYSLQFFANSKPKKYISELRRRIAGLEEHSAPPFQ
jgi:hypothetical protein